MSPLNEQAMVLESGVTYLACARVLLVHMRSLFRAETQLSLAILIRNDRINVLANKLRCKVDDQSCELKLACQLRMM